MAWPDDPYRTGQQLYRQARAPAGRVHRGAARRCRPSRRPRRPAIVYLPLHRTRTLAVTGQTLTFGFRAASTTGAAEAAALAALADLDLMQARRHAADPGRVHAGQRPHRAAEAAGATLRGLAAVQADWADRRTSARGQAAMFDCRCDLPGSRPWTTPASRPTRWPSAPSPTVAASRRTAVDRRR